MSARRNTAAAAADGSLLTYALNVVVKGHTYIYGSSLTREIDTVAHYLGSATALNLGIFSKPTCQIDVDQLAGGNVVVSWVEQPLRQPGAASYFRIYDATGHAITAKTAFAVNGQVTALADGGFCATFSSVRNESLESFAQTCAADGTVSGSAFRMNSAVAGTLLTLWNDQQDTNARSIMGRFMTTAGKGLSDTVVVAT
jgi:hypothetical protein